jgi:hypothetical protein
MDTNRDYYYYYLTAIGLTPGGSSIHLHTNSTQNTEHGTHITITRKITIIGKLIGKCGPCPVFASYTLEFSLQLTKKHGKPSVRVLEICPGIPVAVVQYTFTSKQYKQQHNDTERYIHNNKNT